MLIKIIKLRVEQNIEILREFKDNFRHFIPVCDILRKIVKKFT